MEAGLSGDSVIAEAAHNGTAAISPNLTISVVRISG